jgi:hypothetical protein
MALIVIIQMLLIGQLYHRTDQLKTQELKATIIDAVRSLNTEPAVDPQSGRHFLPEYRIVLPAKLESRIYYRAGGEASYIWLTDANSQNSAVTRLRTAESLTDTFKQVEVLQKCSRQVVLGINTMKPESGGDSLTLKSTKHLKDGRTIYIYQNECAAGAEPLLRDLDQLESF